MLVVIQNKAPNADILSIENNSLLLDIPVGETRNEKFELRLSLNVKIGIFNAQLEVYDINQTILLNRFCFSFHNSHKISYISLSDVILCILHLSKSVMFLRAILA